MADGAIQAIERFIQAIGMDKTAADFGVPEADFPAISEEVRSAFATRVDADPVPTDSASLTEILHRSIT